MVVCRCDCSSGCSSDVRKDHLGSGIAADGAEVRIVERRLNRFVERGVEIRLCEVGFVLGRGEGRETGGIPRHAESIDVEEAVACCDFGFSGGFGVDSGIVGEELGEVVLMDLLAEGVSWCWRCVRMLCLKWEVGLRDLLTRTSSKRQGSE